MDDVQILVTKGEKEMAIKTREELLESINTIIGENTSDEALAIIEDVQDTFSDYDTRLSDTTDWKAKYEENDNAWRTKYRDRFFNSPGSDPEADPEPEPIKKTFEDLFTKEG